MKLMPCYRRFMSLGMPCCSCSDTCDVLNVLPTLFYDARWNRGAEQSAMHGVVRRSEGGDARNKGIVAAEAVESQSEPRTKSEDDDSFFAETKALDAQPGTYNRLSKHVNLRRMDAQSGAANSGADALEPNEGKEADWEVINANKETGEFDTADQLMARNNAAKRAAAAAGADKPGEHPFVPEHPASQHPELGR